MSYLYNTLSPSVIDDEMLQTAVDEQGPKGDAGKVARAEGIEFKDARSLQLDYKNILTIQGLFEFTNLTKLQLDNNIIEKIEGLDKLVHLVWLDLSFNNIEVIEGLDTLTKLEDLTLYNNRISCIENMDTLTNLEIFSIGNNDIRHVDNILYLRRFRKLKTLNLSRNPLCNLDVYRLYAAAILPHLVYLDYRLLDDDVRRKGYDRYQIQVEEILDNERKAAAAQEEAEKEAADFAYHSAAFIPNLNGPQLFEAMYENDEEGKILNTMPNAEEQITKFSESFEKICHNMFEFGLEAYSKRMDEVNLFWECINEAKSENREAGMKAISDFTAYKEVRFNQMSHMWDPKEVRRAVCGYNAKVTELWNTLMGAELHLLDQIEEIIQNFDLSLQDHVSNFNENIQGFMAQIRELEGNNHEKLILLASQNQDPILRGDIEVPKDLAALFADKDTLLNAIATSHDTHMLVIDQKEDSMLKGISKWHADLVNKVHQEEEIDRNRHRVVEITHFTEHLRDELQNMEMLNIL
ncbi:hypothetical protein BaRGS_00011386 [Batillaria attramentaria]|uniref:Dynein regulatory complex subunit 3 n=1 Tax=Batillaria attramentaria TaxID=370345 RepID=A0ABD0LCP3_9CAEN